MIFFVVEKSAIVCSRMVRGGKSRVEFDGCASMMDSEGGAGIGVIGFSKNMRIFWFDVYFR